MLGLVHRAAAQARLGEGGIPGPVPEGVPVQQAPFRPGKHVVVPRLGGNPG